MKVVISQVPPDVTLRSVEAVPLEDFFDWAGRVVGHVQVGASLGEGETDSGWPMYLVRTGDGALAALYRIHEYAAAVVVENGPAVLEDDALERYRALLARARPDWACGEAISLAEMWDE